MSKFVGAICAYIVKPLRDGAHRFRMLHQTSDVTPCERLSPHPPYERLSPHPPYERVGVMYGL